MSARWTYVVGGTPPSGVERRELTQAYGRQLTLRIDSPSTAQFTLDGRSTEASEIEPLATDLHVYRDGVKIFRGRIGTEQSQLDESRHVASYTATDYRGMLKYRIVGAAGATFAAVDQGLIAWTLISTSQALTGGNWGITNGAGATSGTVRDRTYLPGKPLADAIDELGRVDGGFEWWISPSLALERFYPRRGSVTGVVLDWAGSVGKLSRLLSPGDFANFVLVTGASSLTPETGTSATIATDPRGRWETSIGFPDVVEQSTLDTKADWLIAQASTLRPDIAMTFAPDQWGGTASVNVGDTVTLAAYSGQLQLTGPYRVGEIGCVPGDDGGETIIAGLVAA